MTKRQIMTKLSAAYDRGHTDGYEAGKRDGQMIAEASAKATMAQERQSRVLDANLKLASSLGQMVEAVSRAVNAFTSDNNTLR